MTLSYLPIKHVYIEINFHNTLEKMGGHVVFKQNIDILLK